MNQIYHIISYHIIYHINHIHTHTHTHTHIYIYGDCSKSFKFHPDFRFVIYLSLAQKLSQKSGLVFLVLFKGVVCCHKKKCSSMAHFSGLGFEHFEQPSQIYIMCIILKKN